MRKKGFFFLAVRQSVVMLKLAFILMSLSTAFSGSTVSDRIIGGVKSPSGKKSSYVMLLNERKGHACGGTLIQPNLVLTAAHCVFDNDAWDAAGGPGVAPPTLRKKILLAKNNIKYDWRKGVMVGADAESTSREIFVHPDYLYEVSDENDIAIIRTKTSEPLPKPFVRLAGRKESLRFGANVTAVGFGVNDNYISDDIFYPPPRLFEVDLTVGQPGVMPCPPRMMDVQEDKEVCLVGGWFYQNPGRALHSDPDPDFGIGLKSVCSGDSGGPVYSRGKQFGIASRVLDIDLCRKFALNPYMVYTLVSAHRRDFIDPIVAANPFDG